MRVLPFLFIAVLALCACYHPLYGDKPLGMEATPQEQRLNSVGIAPIDNEQGQHLRNLLIDRMYGQGRPAQTSTRLETQLLVAEEHLGLQKNATTARARLTVTANYKLIDSKTHKVLLAATNRSIVSFNILDEQYATLASRENAYDRGLTEVADRMVNRLLLYFDSGK